MNWFNRKKKEDNEIKELLEKILYVLLNKDIKRFMPNDAKKILGKEIYEKISKL